MFDICSTKLWLPLFLGWGCLINPYGPKILIIFAVNLLAWTRYENSKNVHIQLFTNFVQPIEKVF